MIRFILGITNIIIRKISNLREYFSRHFISSLVVLLFCSCQKNPEALFKIDSPNNWTLENINLYNISSESHSYLWDFGDGNTSTEFSPIIFYELPDTYTISLNAYSKDKEKVSEYMEDIVIVQPTDLWMTVKQLNDSSPSVNCAVYLYESYTDWKQYKAIDSLFTDEDGYVYFRNLKSIIYWIDANKSVEDGYWHNWKTNYNTVTPLVENRINKIDIFLDFYYY